MAAWRNGNASDFDCQQRNQKIADSCAPRTKKVSMKCGSHGNKMLIINSPKSLRPLALFKELGFLIANRPGLSQFSPHASDQFASTRITFNDQDVIKLLQSRYVLLLVTDINSKVVVQRFHSFSPLALLSLVIVFHQFEDHVSPKRIELMLTYILGILVISLFIIYRVLVIISPKRLISTPTERRYLSSKSPKPLPLSSLEDPPTIDLSIIIPAFNESQRLPLMLDSTIKHLATKQGRTCEILVVDDGSRDQTIEVALDISKKQKAYDIRVVKLDKNVGKGGAVRHGFLHGRGKRLLMVDADGASQFSDLELLWKEMDKIEKDGHGIAVGSRAHLVTTEAVVKRSALRNFLMHGFHMVLRTLGVRHIRDTQCGFKLFTRKSAQHLFPPLHLASWVFDVELLIRAQLLDIPVAEVPIAWHEVAGSKLSIVSDSFGMFKDLVILRLNFAFGRWTVNEGKVKVE